MPEQAFKLTRIKRDGQQPSVSAHRFGAENAEKALAFHRSFPEYSETPLVSLSSLAADLGLGAISVKDESYRFGLNAFKVLGGSYAIGKWIAQRLDRDITELPYSRMVSPDISALLGKTTFITATDGNHGRGIAWTANRLKQNCVVYMPAGTAEERLNNIRSLGADASILACNYDACVRRANEMANAHQWVMVQDTAWEGYEDIPGWIMDGYTTLALEAARQLGDRKPTHVFLQAGVGAMAGAVTAFLTDYYGRDKPVIVIVEPNKADCIYRTAEANDGQRHFVTGAMDTIMAGLACGEPCTIAWEILRTCADFCLSIPEYAAADGMRVLSSPLGNDRRIISGESGASAFGALYELMLDSHLSGIRDEIGLDVSSRVLCISTEGATDLRNYRRIIREGYCPKP